MALAKHYQMRSRDRVCRHGITVSQCYALEVIVERRSLALRIKRDIRAEHRAVFEGFSVAELAACERVLEALLWHHGCAPHRT